MGLCVRLDIRSDMPHQPNRCHTSTWLSGDRTYLVHCMGLTRRQGISLRRTSLRSQCCTYKRRIPSCRSRAHCMGWTTHQDIHPRTPCPSIRSSKCTFRSHFCPPNSNRGCCSSHCRGTGIGTVSPRTPRGNWRSSQSRTYRTHHRSSLFDRSTARRSTCLYRCTPRWGSQCGLGTLQCTLHSAKEGGTSCSSDQSTLRRHRHGCTYTPRPSRGMCRGRNTGYRCRLDSEYRSGSQPSPSCRCSCRAQRGHHCTCHGRYTLFRCCGLVLEDMNGCNRRRSSHPCNVCSLCRSNTHGQVNCSNRT
eukprot:PhM_4_TR2453/c2_g1_i1/m.64998